MREAALSKEGGTLHSQRRPSLLTGGWTQIGSEKQRGTPLGRDSSNMQEFKKKLREIEGQEKNTKGNTDLLLQRENLV